MALGKSLTATIFGVDKASPVFQQVGKSSEAMSSKVVAAAKKAVLQAAAVASIGAILKSGWDRLTSIENAEAKLSGLGHSAGEVKAIMDDALAAVKGTAFGMDEAATVAATAVAAGIKPGQQLESTLRLVADAATIAGVGMDQMGSIFNKVAASGKLTGDVVQQLNDQGIPILQFLGKTLGKTTTEIQDMVSKGKISFDDFSKAMQEGLGGAALKSGETTTGAMKNMMASFSRFGATLLKDVQPLAKDVFGQVTAAVDGLGKAAGGLISILNGIPGPVKAGLLALAGWKLFASSAVFGKLAAAAKGFGEEMALQQHLAKMGGQELTNLGAAAQVTKGKLAGVGKTMAKGGLLAAGVAVISSIAGEFGKISAQQEQVVEGQKSIAQALTDSNGKWTEQVQLAQNAAIEGTDFYKDAINAGMDYKTVVLGLTGSQEDYQRLQVKVAQSGNAALVLDYKQMTALRGQKDASNDLYNQQQDTIKAQKAENEQRDEAAKKAAGQRDETVKLQGAIEGTSGATSAGTEITADFTDAQDDAKVQSGKTREAFERQGRETDNLGRSFHDSWGKAAELKAGLVALEDQRALSAAAQRTAAKVRDTAKAMQEGYDKAHDLTSASSDLGAELARLAGREPTVEEATRRLNGAMSDAIKAAKGGTDGFAGLGRKLIDTKGKIDTTTPSGQALYDTVTKLGTAAQDAALAQASLAGKTGGTKAAADAANRSLAASRREFIANAKQMGLTAAEAKKLADRYFGIPKDITTVVTGISNFADVDNKIQRLRDTRVTVDVTGSYQGTRGLPAAMQGGVMAGLAAGGAVVGSTPRGVDAQPRMLAVGEHVLTTRDVGAMGGQAGVYAFRRALHRGMPGMAAGGAVSGVAGRRVTVIRDDPRKLDLTVDVTFGGDGELTDAMARTADVRIGVNEVARSRRSQVHKRTGVRV